MMHRSDKKPIGIFGGTFDPIHLGHIQVAQQALNSLALEKILFIPCGQPSLRATPMAPAQKRLAMLNLAVKNQPKFEVDTREIQRAGTSYMVDTLQSLKVDYSRQPLCLILGKDAFNKLNQWHQWKSILTLAHLIVVDRPNCGNRLSVALKDILRAHLTNSPKDFTTNDAGKIYFLKIEPIAISATKVRERIKNNQSLSELLDPHVIDYIRQSSLYLSHS